MTNKDRAENIVERTNFSLDDCSFTLDDGMSLEDAITAALDEKDRGIYCPNCGSLAGPITTAKRPRQE